MMILLFTVLFLYLLAMGWILVGTTKLASVKLVKMEPRTKFSIVVPFRNERDNLPNLLESIATQEYPLDLFEVILVDDESNDGSLELLQRDMDDLRFKLRIFQNKRISGSPKKDAIVTAIPQANHQWILTTDADCKLPPKWLKVYDQFIQQKNPKMICGPVIYPKERSLVANFQFFDGLSLQAATMGSFGWNKPLLSNGANLGYEKSVFLEIGGYEGNDHIASGDDIFLMEKTHRKFPKQVYYLKNKEAAVLTKAEVSWKDVIEQRIRWASKTTQQQSLFAKVLGVIVFFMNILLIACLVATIIDPDNYQIYTAFILHKIVLDVLVMTTAASFFKTPFSIGGYLLSSLIYPFVSTWVVMNSFKGTYVWKDRSFHK